MDEGPTHDDPDESPNQRLKYTDIQDQLDSFAILGKPYHQGGEPAMNQVVDQLQLPEDLAIKLRTIMYGRDGLHLLRMLKRHGAERDFGIAYLHHRDDIYREDSQTTRQILHVIGSEGHDTSMFWTFAPYLFKSLVKMGLSERESIKKVLQWSKNGISVQNANDGWYTAHLKGLETYGREGWVLDENPNHISHRFTEQEAENIAKIL